MKGGRETREGWSVQKRTRIMKGEREKGKYCLSCDVLDFFRSLEGMLCRRFDDIDEILEMKMISK